MTDGESLDAAGFIDSVWRYLRILGGVLALVGLFLVIGLQSGWIGIVWSPPPAFVEVLANDESLGGPTVKITGPKNLFSKEKIAVDTSKIYRLDADVRVLPKKDGSVQTSLVYFGVSTYDENGNELKSPPGAYRYAGAAKRNIRSDQGWVHLRGTISGEGDVSHKQFRPGTSTVRLVLLANYHSTDEPVMLIRDVTFSDFLELAP